MYNFSFIAFEISLLSHILFISHFYINVNINFECIKFFNGMFESFRGIPLMRNFLEKYVLVNFLLMKK